MPKYLNLQRASERTGYPRDYLKSEAYAGRLRVLDASGLWVVTPAELSRWMRIWQGRN